MCTLVMLYRPTHRWPLLLAGNRDEMRGRPSAPPGRHWRDLPQVVAGLDRLAGGSWLGINDAGLVAVILNRQGSLGPAPDRRSRGELVLAALGHTGLEAAAAAVAARSPADYRSFNLVLADARQVLLVQHRESGRIEVEPVSPGLHMLNAGELDDKGHPRISGYLPRFQAAALPDPEAGDWQAWCDLLSCREVVRSAMPEAAMNLDFPNGFGTRSASLIALPADPQVRDRPMWWFADGPPDTTPFRPVEGF
jgi:uncharacterized protein with NRDE domain